MNKLPEAIEEKFSLMMCDFEKIATLIKLIKELQYDDTGYNKKDLQNLSAVLFEQVNLTRNELKDIEKLLNQIDL